MNRRYVFSITYAVITAFTTTWYVYHSIVGPLKPVLATWLMFFVATSVALFTYCKSGKKSIAGNIMNTVDIIMTATVSLVLWGLGRPLGQDRLEMVCFGLVGLILAYYFWSRKAFTANLAINSVMVIAYFPTVSQLWVSGKNSESFILWGFGWFGAILASYNPIRDRDHLAAIYGIRAVIMSSIILILMFRFWN